jgi:hypothetical protein
MNVLRTAILLPAVNTTTTNPHRDHLSVVSKTCLNKFIVGLRKNRRPTRLQRTRPSLGDSDPE